jgi:hypothetical protein
MQNFLGSVCGQQEQARKPTIGFAAEKGGMIPKKERSQQKQKRGREDAAAQLM